MMISDDLLISIAIIENCKYNKKRYIKKEEYSIYKANVINTLLEKKIPFIYSKETRYKDVILYIDDIIALKQEYNINILKEVWQNIPFDLMTIIMNEANREFNHQTKEGTIIKFKK